MFQFAFLPALPSGKEILASAKVAHFIRAARATAKVAGKNCSFTPAEIDVHAPQAVGAGVVIGRIDTKLPGDETALRAGVFDIYLANVNGTWRAFAESKGKIIAEAKHVTVDVTASRSLRKTAKPLFHPHGWCWSHTFNINYRKGKVVFKMKLTISICF